VAPIVATDPFVLRDRLLLPIENRVLREVKRSIVGLQNEVLEGLRISGTDWRPTLPPFNEAVSGELAGLARESFVAGRAAASQLVGAEAPAPAEVPVRSGIGAEFAVGLEHAVEAAFERAAGTDGPRKIGAAVSRVFRGWRTDEAERRVRYVARRAYHDGVLAGFVELGVSAVTAVATGRPCGACAAGSGAVWAPGEAPPDDMEVPPAGPECGDTIVPAG
jgi:hypothetical protein